MVEIKELEELCKSQYATDKLDRSEDFSFTHLEQKGDFLVASKAEEKIVKNEQEDEHKESSAVYFVVQCKDGKPIGDTLLIELAAHETYYWDGGLREGTNVEATHLRMRQNGEEVARVRTDKYYNVADKDQLVCLVCNSDNNITRSRKTHNNEDYSWGKERISKRQDLITNLDRISRAFGSFVMSDADIKKEMDRLKRESFNAKKAKLKDRIKKHVDKIKEPFIEISENLSEIKGRVARRRKEKEITNSLPSRSNRSR